MATTDPENAGCRKRLTLLTPADRERIEQPRLHVIGFVEPAPPYHPGPRRTLPSWAAHLRELRPLRLVE